MRIYLAVLTSAALMGTAFAADETTLSIVFSLQDGSRIVGQIAPAPVAIESPSLGNLKIPLANVRSIQLSKDQPVAHITLQNGDRVAGQIRQSSFRIATVFGQVMIPLEVVASIEVGRVGSKHVEWEALPFPADSNWGSGRGALALIEPDGMLLRGQPVRTRQVYTLPTTVECEATLEQGLLRAAELQVYFVPENTPKDRNLTEVFAMLIKSMDVDRDGGQHQLKLWRMQNRRWSELWSGKPFFLEVGRNYQLSVELDSRGTRIKMNDQRYDVDGVTVPFAKFHIQILGWVPDNRWRVRNVDIH